MASLDEILKGATQHRKDTAAYKTLGHGERARVDLRAEVDETLNVLGNRNLSNLMSQLNGSPLGFDEAALTERLTGGGMGAGEDVMRDDYNMARELISFRAKFTAPPVDVSGPAPVQQYQAPERVAPSRDAASVQNQTLNNIVSRAGRAASIVSPMAPSLLSSTSSANTAVTTRKRSLTALDADENLLKPKVAS